jgi:tetratricopeptide (TPR) repeat protein
MEGKYKKVVAESDKLIDAGAYGREELCYLKGLSLMRLDRRPEARAVFAYMTERYPRGRRVFDAYTATGDSYFLERKYDEALAAYSAALKQFPDHKNSAAVYYKIGSTYEKLGMDEKAGEYFAKVRAQSPLSFESRMSPKDTHAVPKPPAVPASGNQPIIILSDEAKRELQADPDSGDYYVQAGYFKTKANADKLNEKLLKKGYESYIATIVRSGQTFYRVKVGRLKSKPEADALAAKLKADGHFVKVCR